MLEVIRQAKLVFDGGNF